MSIQRTVSGMQIVVLEPGNQLQGTETGHMQQLGRLQWSRRIVPDLSVLAQAQPVAAGAGIEAAVSEATA